MLDRPVRDSKLAQIMAHHLGFDLHLLELLALIDSHHAADHLRHHNHIPQMRLDEVRFLVWLRFLLGLAQLLDEAHRLALEATVEPTSGARVDDITELFGGEIEELVEVDAAEIRRASGRERV